MPVSYTTAVTVNDPIGAINDMAPSLDRVIEMLASSTTDLMELVVGPLDGNSPQYRPAYAVWCTSSVALEKMREIALVLGEAEPGLLALRSAARGA